MAPWSYHTKGFATACPESLLRFEVGVLAFDSSGFPMGMTAGPGGPRVGPGGPPLPAVAVDLEEIRDARGEDEFGLDGLDASAAELS